MWRWPGFDWRAYWPQTESWLFADEDDTDDGNTGSGNTGSGYTGGDYQLLQPNLFSGSKNVNASYDNLDDSVMVAPPPSNNNDDEDDTLGDDIMVMQNGIYQQCKAPPYSIQENSYAERSLHSNSFDDSILGDNSFRCSKRYNTRISKRQKLCLE